MIAGIIAAIKAFFSAIGELFGWLDRKQLLEAGRAEQAGEQSRETLETAKAVHAPITDDERERVWSRLQKQRVGRVPVDPKP